MTSQQAIAPATPAVEHDRDRAGCAQVDVATGFGMGQVPDLRWPFVVPALIDVLLAHGARPCEGR